MYINKKYLFAICLAAATVIAVGIAIFIIQSQPALSLSDTTVACGEAITFSVRNQTDSENLYLLRQGERPYHYTLVMYESEREVVFWNTAEWLVRSSRGEEVRLSVTGCQGQGLEDFPPQLCDGRTVPDFNTGSTTHIGFCAELHGERTYRDYLDMYRVEYECGQQVEIRFSDFGVPFDYPIEVFGNGHAVALEPGDFFTAWNNGEYRIASGWAPEIGEHSFNVSGCTPEIQATAPEYLCDPERSGGTMPIASSFSEGESPETHHLMICGRN